jgi:hypothetical protein
MDAALGGFMADSLVLVRDGVADLDRRATEKGGDGFVALSGQQQAIILRDVETTPFFGTVHFLTLCGLFALPAYGGNRDGEGWRQLGFVRQHHWQPPFGHYDAVWRTEGNVDDA